MAGRGHYESALIGQGYWKTAEREDRGLTCCHSVSIVVPTTAA